MNESPPGHGTLDLHPQLRPLSFLVGRWAGQGRGDYPTIDSFEYREEIEFGHAGKPFLAYRQRTWSPTGEPLHTEFGYLRPVGEAQAELVIAQPTGITEIHSGSVGDGEVCLRALHVGRSPTAKDVVTVTRDLRVVGDDLSYRLEMAAVGQELQFHLEATLHRVG